MLCVKSVRIRSYSGPYSVQKGHFLRSDEKGYFYIVLLTICAEKYCFTLFSIENMWSEQWQWNVVRIASQPMNFPFGSIKLNIYCNLIVMFLRSVWYNMRCIVMKYSI